MIKGTVPKNWRLKPPPRYGAESSSLMSHTQNRLIQVIRPRAAKTTLSDAFGTATCANRAKKKSLERKLRPGSVCGKGGQFGSPLTIAQQKGRGRVWGEP